MARFLVIIGAARSGTKFLRGLLEASPEVCAVPYDVNYIWRQGLEDRADDALPREEATPARATRIRAALRRAAGARDEGSLVVEKTVSNTLRVGFVDQVLPEARFVHLVRDGRDVAESAARMWQAPPDFKYLARKLAAFPLRNAAYGWWYLKNLAGGLVSPGRGVKVWGPRYPGIETDAASLAVLDLCAAQWRACVERALADLDAVEAGRVFTLKYEDLVTDGGVLAELCRFAALADPARVLERHALTVRADDVGKWRRLPPVERDRLADTLRPVLDRLGYP